MVEEWHTDESYSVVLVHSGIGRHMLPWISGIGPFWMILVSPHCMCVSHLAVSDSLLPIRNLNGLSLELFFCLLPRDRRFYCVPLPPTVLGFPLCFKGEWRDSCLSNLKGMLFCWENREKDLDRAVYFPPQRLLLSFTRPTPWRGFLIFSSVTNLSCESLPAQWRRAWKLDQILCVSW